MKSKIIGKGSGNRTAASASVAQNAKAVPAAPPRRNRSTLSATSWRTSRPRPAPTASRTAISRDRAVARARKMLATLTLAMSSTMPDTTSSSAMNSVTGPRASSIIAE